MIWADELPVKIKRGEYIKPLSLEWHHARRGRLTASKRAQTIFKENPKSWDKMVDDIIYEMSDNWVLKEFSAPATDWGQDHEREAIEALSYSLKEEITDPGFILHPDYDFAGSTPDGYIGDDISVQIKCPYNSKIHMETFVTLKISEVYFYQCQWEMWTSGRKECYFASYDPRQPISSRLAIISIDRDNSVCDTFDRNTLKFARLLQQGSRHINAEPKQSGVATNLF